MFMKKGGKHFCYRSYRDKNGKVRKEYLGDATSEASQNFMRELEHRKVTREERKNYNKEMISLKSSIDKFSSLTDMMMRLYLIENKLYKRKSEIRRIKYAE